MNFRGIAVAALVLFVVLVGVSIAVPGPPWVFWSKLYTEAKAWQTGIGAFFGLIAILAGALYNAKLNRDRDKELREEEARAVATMICREMLFITRPCAAIRLWIVELGAAPADLGMT